jgi:hypothetical protein
MTRTGHRGVGVVTVKLLNITVGSDPNNSKILMHWYP